MSKVGKKLITIPSGVEITVDGMIVRVKGPKGELSEKLVDGVLVSVADGNITVTVDAEERWNLWGLYRSLIANMVTGVTE
jgi:large subunit ribosomal protein L6